MSNSDSCHTSLAPTDEELRDLIMPGLFHALQGAVTAARLLLEVVVMLLGHTLALVRLKGVHQSLDRPTLMCT